jgi:hypothetical protein
MIFIILFALILGTSAQTDPSTTPRTTTTTTRAPLPSTVPPVTLEQTLICETLKPRGAPPYLKGDGGFELKLSMTNDGLLSIDVTSEKKTQFIGNSSM